MTGKTSYCAGVAAEDQVADRFQQMGHKVTDRRWRGLGGEIDLVAQGPEGIVFVEVKKAKDFARAAERVTRRQLERIFAAATEYLGALPDGLLTPARIDVALVDGHGRIEMIENAYCP